MATISTSEAAELYTLAAQHGLDKTAADALARRTQGRSGVDSLTRSGYYGYKTNLLDYHPAAPARVSAPMATERQIGYAVSLGASLAEVQGMTRTEISALIDLLKSGRSTTTATARAAGRRHGISGEVWD